MSDGHTSQRRALIPFKVRGPRDFYGGLALIGLAIIALWASRDLPGLHGVVFGPGTAPRIFATLLGFVGALVALNGLLKDGPKIEAYALRGPAYVLTAILIFAITFRGINLDYIGLPFHVPQFGLVASTFFAFMISIMGSREMRWLEALLAGVTMTVFCVVLFVYLLRLPFPLWPWS